MKYYISGEEELVSDEIKAFVAFREWRVPKKNIRGGSWS